MQAAMLSSPRQPAAAQLCSPAPAPRPPAPPTAAQRPPVYSWGGGAASASTPTAPVQGELGTAVAWLGGSGAMGLRSLSAGGTDLASPCPGPSPAPSGPQAAGGLQGGLGAVQPDQLQQPEQPARAGGGKGGVGVGAGAGPALALMHPGLQTVAVRGLAQPSSPLLVQGRGAGQGGAAGGWSEIWASGQPALRRAAAAGCLPPAAPRVPVPASPHTRAPARRPRPPTVPPLALAGLCAGGCEGPGGPGAPPCLQAPLAVAQGCGAEEEEAELAGWAARSGRWQPAHQGRCYVYPPTSWQDVAAVQQLMAGLAPAAAAQVRQLWSQLMQARYATELMASRGVRVAKDITAEWSHMTSGLLNRIEQYESHVRELLADKAAQESIVHELRSQLRALHHADPHVAGARTTVAGPDASGLLGCSGGGSAQPRSGRAGGDDSTDVHCNQLQLELWAANELLRQAGENARRALADLHTTNQRCEALRRQNLELQQCCAQQASEFARQQHDLRLELEQARRQLFAVQSLATLSDNPRVSGRTTHQPSSSSARRQLQLSPLCHALPTRALACSPTSSLNLAGSVASPTTLSLLPHVQAKEPARSAVARSLPTLPTAYRPGSDLAAEPAGTSPRVVRISSRLAACLPLWIA
ncbi:hypothetical protein V8C86DRAFT_3148199 [Haematococcus lacustris]